MTLFKSTILGSAAALVAVTGASAADLAISKPAPAEYVRICSAEGKGFFYIPGTETCLRVSGQIRFRVNLNSDPGHDRDADKFQFRTRARVQVDARQETEFGKLRAFIRLQGERRNGADRGVTIDQAFIQWGGLVAGRTTSLFAADTIFDSAGFDDPADLIGYQFTTDGGFYGGVSLEAQRDVGAIGRSMPDIAGRVGFEQDWGKVQLSAVAVQNRFSRAADEAEFGFAVQGHGGFNIGGGKLTVQALYASDASGYYDGLDFLGGDFGERWGLGAKYTANFNPNFEATLGVGYDHFDADGANNDFHILTIGANAFWKPLGNSDFLIGPEVVYRTSDEEVFGGGLNNGGEDSSLAGFFQILRNF
jgi:hypothetical protein